MRTRILTLIMVLLAAFTASVQAQDVIISSSQSYTIANAASPSNGTVDKYRWFRNNVLIEGATGATYTIPVGTALGTYKYVRQAHAKDCDMWVSSNVFTVQVLACHAPGATATMQNFFPCTAAANSTWTLTDARADAGGQSYKVRLMEDGRYWMVEDLKYPLAACNKTTFAGAKAVGSIGARVPGFYGDCRNNTQAGAGYLYDWMFAMQHKDAYYTSSWNPNCTGNGSSNALCRGICPAGWHLPTGNPTTGEFTLLNKAANGGKTNTDAGLRSSWGGVYGGYSGSTGTLNHQGSSARYWSSSFYSAGAAYHLYFYSTGVNPATLDGYDYKYNGFSVRCVRNY